MTIIRWSPLQEIESLQQEMNHLFETFSPTPQGPPESAKFIPAIEIYETPDMVYLQVELPGLDPKHLDIQVAAEAISIKGERRAENVVEKNGVTRSEFRYGQFHRVIPLPARVQNTEVKANYKNGILNLALPKHESDKNRVVKVNVN
jgi:HSP20 family protein